MKKIRIGIVGTGWRAGFFVHVIASMPERFELIGAVYRSNKGKERAGLWGIPLLDSHEALKDLGPDFVILSVDRDNTEKMMIWYANHNIPILNETFPAKNIEELQRLYAELNGAKIQIAEQYPFQPLNAARIALSESGLLGNIYQVQTSIPNGYHAAGVQRKILKTGRRCPVIRANKYTHTIIAGPNRDGDPTEEKQAAVNQTLSQLDWGSKQALNDLEDNQHRSFIRTQHWVIRGERGELRGEEVYYLKDIVTPCHFTLERVMAGSGPNLEGLYLRGVRGGQYGWFYQNPFIPVRFFDDEIAVAACLVKMVDYITEGKDFYPISEGIMDMYVALMIAQATSEGGVVNVPSQPWTE